MKNGAKQFIFVVRFQSGPNRGNEHRFLLRSDHDPSVEELVKLLGLDYDEMHDEIEVQRYDIDSLPTLPPKGTQ